jgi:peroxiredoxin
VTGIWAGLVVLLLVAGAAYLYYRMHGARQVPEQLRRGQPLPEFAALDEAGNPLHTRDLRETPVVMIFVRGNWCPFCSRQVKNLTGYYKDIVDLGARLVLVTPRPQETTQRVARFFDVELEFWLDESLAAHDLAGVARDRRRRCHPLCRAVEAHYRPAQPEDPAARTAESPRSLNRLRRRRR